VSESLSFHGYHSFVCPDSVRLGIDRNGKRKLAKFVALTRDKGEYRRGTAILMLSGKGQGRRKVKDVARELNVSVNAVIGWKRRYRSQGLDGLKAGEHTGRPARVKARARRRMRELLKQDPQAFGFLKGRWVVRDIATALSRENIMISRSHVHNILSGELDLAYKRPKLTVKSNDPNYYRKAREIERYKRIAPALAKRG
jgi:transposase